MIQLRPYQLEAARAIVDSIWHRKGHTITVEISRQGGKNEMSAQLEVFLLAAHMMKGGNLIKCSPTFKPQTVNSMLRLKERLSDAGLSQFARSELGYMICVNKARAIFFSAGEQANVVGATAHILMEVDEAQDVSKDKYNKDFRPMGATTNCTTVLFGTAWDSATLLEEQRQLNLELEKADGIRRHFEYNWQEVAKHNPAYAEYVAAERQRLGADHPLFTTQYELKPLTSGGGYLSPQQLAQIHGDHERQHLPRGGNTVYVAGLDLAGEDEELEDAMLRAAKPKKDSTVLTIAALDLPADPIVQIPRARIVEHYYRTGVPHPALYAQVIDVVRNVWPVKKLYVDATGAGAPFASVLQSALGSVCVPFVFTQQTKSKLAFGLLAAANAGLIKMYQDDGSEESKLFWQELTDAKSEALPNQCLRFYVPEEKGHDDLLMSLALCVEAASQFKSRSARGQQR